MMEQTEETKVNELSQPRAPFGMLAEFANPKVLLDAAKALRQAGYEKFDTHSPFPVHGMDRAMGLGDSKLGWLVMFSAIIGGAGIFVLQAWAAMVAYPIITSGKPLLSTEAFIPTTFELIVLSAGFAAVFGMLALNKLPLFYHPVFKSKHFHKASTHGFFVSIEADDTQFEALKTRVFLEKLGGTNIELLEK